VSTSTHFHVALPFEAARQIHALPAGAPTARLHGHSFLASLRCALPRNYAPYPGGELETLQAQWGAQLQALDYGHLNDHIDTPTDGAIAHWLQAQCTVPGLVQVALQSTPQRGVDIAFGSSTSNGDSRAWRRYAFQSAHKLPNVPAGHKCGNMHGHGFEVILHTQHGTDAAPSDHAYAAIDAAWAPLQAALNYACLNELAGLENPTSEIMSSWIWARLKPTLPALCKVTVFETASCGAVFDGTHYRIWKDLTLDSALRFKAAPAGNPRRQLHGHTYTLRLHLSAPLDQMMGWTVDFGDVKTLFDPVFKALDHKPLHEIVDLADCDTATVAAWILTKARSVLPQVSGVDLFETQGVGVSVHVG
jgi:6-pyruvoyltetrahydropterin/6-carboxytetrahydropterin synthase